MTAKEYLSQGRWLDKRIEARIAERDRIMALAMAARTPQLTGMPRGGKHDWTDTVDKAIDLTKDIDKEIRELCRIKRELRDTIDRVEDYRCRVLLELRYRSDYTWGQIAEAMGYELRQVYRIHGEALLKIKFAV